MNSSGPPSSFPPETIVDLVRHWVRESGESVLYRFLKPTGQASGLVDDGNPFDEQTITYSELNEAACRIAVWLASRVSPGDRVILAFPPGCEYLKAYFGCLYAGVIAVPAYPPRRNQRDQRLHAIIADADVRLALTTSGLLDSVIETMADATQVVWHSIESIESSDVESDVWVEPKIDASTLAFLQYTSGSTGTPKGVMVTHGNLIHNQKLTQSSFRSTSGHDLIGWLPLHHDMGLIGNALHPLYLGSSLTFMSPIDFLQKPVRWLQAISLYGGKVSGGPNFAYRLCADEIADSDMNGIDLSCWQVAFNGAEPIDADVLDRFATRFEPYGFSHDRFCPCYGMAETTLLVSSSVRGESVRLATNEESSGRWVGCGVAHDDMDVRIVDDQTFQEMPPGQTGEIWICGPSVTAGYWKRTQQTQETFAATMEGSSKRYLRTGDLGWIDPHDGEIYVTGRCKDLLIVRGVNYYPQDIERTSEVSHAACAIGGCAAFSIHGDDGECLVITQEVRRSARRSMKAEEVVESIRNAVVDAHQLAPVSILLLRPGSLPKTTSGKVQRSEARRLYEEDQFRVEHRWDLHRPPAQSQPKDGGSRSHESPMHGTGGRIEHAKSRDSITLDSITRWLIEKVAHRVKLPIETIDPGEPLSRYGLDSPGAVRLAGDLSEYLEREIPPTLAYEYPTISALASYLSGDDRSRTHSGSSSRDKASRTKSNESDAIAIVGIGCRFPMADSPEAFFNLLVEGQDAVRDPADLARFKDGRWSSLDPAFRRAGYLPEVDQFDAGFFGISPREADAIDPQHRLLLETTHEAFEDAGIPITGMRGQPVGVFVGASHQDYLRLSNASSVNAYSASGNAMAMAAGRISYTFDFCGPSLTIDTACSSSLVGTHQAIRSIRNGECDFAIASGVNLILSDEATQSFAQAGMLSKTGVCRAFDDQANGFVRGEGAGTVLMRPLADALADGNRVYCVVTGSAVNQDGRSNGLTAPSRAAQSALIQEALNDAGVSPDEVDYVEAHGTGTSLGDPIELRAIREAMIESRPNREVSLRVGSVKSNIGHLEAAAGIAGLIKVALSMHHEQLPPQINFDQPNSNITWDQEISISTQSLPWLRSAGEPQVAGVSSFGFSGTNAHVIVRQSPVLDQDPVHPNDKLLNRDGDPLVTSAKCEASLTKMVERIQEIASTNDQPTLAYNLAVGRSHYQHRAAKIGTSPDAAWITNIARRNPRVDFYFSGQGGVHPGWGKSLYHSNSTFSKHFDELADAYQRITHDDLKERLWGVADLWADVLIQPAIYSVQVATAKFWQSIGVEINRVVGHSLGEYAAAAIAGVFDIEDGLKMVAQRAALAGKLPHRGAMLAVFAGEDELREALRGTDDAWDLAVVNGPRQTVVAGMPEAMVRLTQFLKVKGLASRVMSTTHGFHSRLIDPMLDEFEAVASTVQMNPPVHKMISTQTGKELSTDVSPHVATPAYWRSNLRSPVRFDLAMQAMVGDGKTLGIEIGAGSTLASLTRSSKFGLDVLPGMIDHPEKGSNHGETLAKLYLGGVNFDWGSALGSPLPRISIPTYEFDRSRHWIESPASAPESPLLSGTNDHASPGCRLDVASGDVVYQTVITAESGFLDHEVAGSTVFPAAGVFWWAYQAIVQEDPQCRGDVTIDDWSIDRSLILQPSHSMTSQVILANPAHDQPTSSWEGSWSVRDESGWHRHARWGARRRVAGTTAKTMPLEPTQVDHLQPQEIENHYSQLSEAGLNYGPSYRCVRELRASGKWADAIITPPSGCEKDVIGMLDSALQVIASTGSHWGTRTWVPVAADQIDFSAALVGKLGDHLHVQAKLSDWNDDTATADVWIGDVNSNVALIHVQGLKLQATTTVDTTNCLLEEKFSPRIRRCEPAGNPVTEFVGTDWYSKMPTHKHSVLEISDALEAVAGHWVGRILSELGVDWKVGQSFTLRQLADRAGVVAAHERLLYRLLEIASEEGWLSASDGPSDHKTGESKTWTVKRSFPCESARPSQIDGHDEFVLLDRCAAAVPRIMQTGDDPLPLLFPRDGQITVANVYRDSVGGQRLNQLASESVQRVVDSLPSGRAIRVLEIGAGTGSTTASVLPHMPPGRCRYDFTDIAPGFFISAKEQFKEFDFVNYRVLNVENDPGDQGFEPQLGSYDLVIAANVLHATADMHTTIENISRLMSPQGQLLVLEGTRPARWMDLTFGLTSGWWRFTDTKVRDHYPLLTCEGWLRLLSDHGFGEASLIDPADPTDTAGGASSPSHLILACKTAAPQTEPSKRMGVVCIGKGGFAERCMRSVSQEHPGEFLSIDTVSADLSADDGHDGTDDRLIREVDAIHAKAAPTHWTLFLDFDDEDFESPAEGIFRASQIVLDLIQAIENASVGSTQPKTDLTVDWVTRNSDHSIVSSGLRGFWRTVTLEYPQWRCRGIDLVFDTGDAKDTRDIVLALGDELLTPADERCEVRLEPNLRTIRELNPVVAPVQINEKAGRSLGIRRRGRLEELEVSSRRRRSPLEGEVEIRVQYAGVNFRDVLNVLGSYPGNPPLGAECVGVVSVVGEGEVDLAVGDHVIAISPDTFADYVTVPATSVCRVPNSMESAGLATLPVVFLTASEALESVAGLKKGESVLIHSAAGGVGMAAVQIANRIGAKIYATASESKHQTLRGLGVEHIFDSRSLGFADAILELTAGSGVDVVLNSLGEDFVEENLRSVSKNGRYVDIALSNATLTQRVRTNRPDIQYSSLDLSQTLASRSNSIRQRLTELVDQVQGGFLCPLPYRSFAIDEAVDAFVWMHNGTNIGKPLIRLKAEETPAPSSQPSNASQQPNIKSAGVHLVTGGLGGLGLLTSDYLIRQGVQEIILLTRREPTERESMILEDWNQNGANVRAKLIDLEHIESVQNTLQEIRNEGTPITAVYHLAGVLQDSVLTEQSSPLFKAVLDPKANGAWNLHQATMKDPIEQFVLFASLSGWLGSPGQANHATANAFLDGLAMHRRRVGLPAVSIGWGPWARVGSAAKRARLGKGDLAGIGMLMPDEGIELLDQVLAWHLQDGQIQPADNGDQRPPTRIAAGRLLVERLPDHLKRDLLFARLIETTGIFESSQQQKPEWIREFQDYPKADQLERVMTHLREAIANSLAMNSSESIPIDSPLFDLGMDSLTSLELVNHLQSTLGVRMSTVELFNYPDVGALAGRLVELILMGSNTRPDEFPPTPDASKLSETESCTPDHEPPTMTETDPELVAVPVPTAIDSERNEVSDLLREIGELNEQFDQWGNES